MKPLSNQEFGALGERFAAGYLRKIGYKILEKNYKTDLGEIDLIAEDRGELVFVEVKTRTPDPYLSGSYAVDRKKQYHIMRSAVTYMQRCPGLQPRFDIIELELDRSSGRLTDINHIKNAFWQNEDYARF
ncbi:YraN family protein [uncultured Ruminococcus sp.]|uniref:YraN family protein n=1 Tax=uncultured Ruminococcus sp. TaxID=165186 RepID=UPI00292D08A0|nr:YraN family protein [uncultured Ruminococcus sp.]